ncbi:2682_t:CDS:2, partial [Gigaspora rosea]
KNRVKLKEEIMDGKELEEKNLVNNGLLTPNQRTSEFCSVCKPGI